MKIFLIALVLLGATARASVAAPNTFPDELSQILESAQSVELYSLEPLKPVEDSSKFHGFRVLGKITLTGKNAQMAAGAFADAVQHGNGDIPDCFDPRHGLRISVGRDHYDFLLCYACSQLVVSKNNQLFAYQDANGNTVTAFSAGGSPKVLNDLLQKYQVPVSHSADVASH